MIEFRIGGRKVPEKRWARELETEIIDQAMSQMETHIHGLVASIEDPETHKHPVVRVRRVGDTSISVETEGSEAYSKLLNDLLQKEGVQGEVPEPTEKNVYLAHATEDKEIARPIAKALLDAGIQVWFDEWEIGYGDSLRRKMEEGLDECTHFVVLLTKTSLQKPWVQEEVDAGLVKKVNEGSRFIGLRYGIDVDQLTPFLKSSYAPEIDPEKPVSVQRLIEEIHGVGCKPSLGQVPQYVSTAPKGLEGWSAAAIAIAHLFVKESVTGDQRDPFLSIEEITEASGLLPESVNDGIMDLVDRGYLEEHFSVGDESWAPERCLFIDFDAPLMGWNPKYDALALAQKIIENEGKESGSLQILSDSLGWDARRTNPAFNYLEAANLVEPSRTFGCHPFTTHCFRFGHRLQRYVRENS